LAGPDPVAKVSGVSTASSIPPATPRWSWLFIALALAGCANADDPEYKIGSSPQIHSSAGAAEAFAAAVAVSPTQAMLDGPVKALASPMPPYPASWRNANIRGEVKVAFTIGPNGAVSDPAVVGSPPPQLAAIVLDSILRWRFEPPTRGGQAVSVRAQQVFRFETR
jgi:protein TonB